MVWVETWLDACRDLLTEDGSLWVLIGDETSPIGWVHQKLVWGLGKEQLCPFPQLRLKGSLLHSPIYTTPTGRLDAPPGVGPFD